MIEVSSIVHIQREVLLMALNNQYLILDSHLNNIGILTVDGATKFTAILYLCKLLIQTIQIPNMMMMLV